MCTAIIPLSNPNVVRPLKLALMNGYERLETFWNFQGLRQAFVYGKLDFVICSFCKFLSQRLFMSAWVTNEGICCSYFGWTLDTPHSIDLITSGKVTTSALNLCTFFGRPEPLEYPLFFILFPRISCVLVADIPAVHSELCHPPVKRATAPCLAPALHFVWKSYVRNDSAYSLSHCGHTHRDVHTHPHAHPLTSHTLAVDHTDNFNDILTFL